MEDDARCCGTGHCMINAQGQCWCGQQWDGTKMCFAPQGAVADAKDNVDAVALPAGNPTQAASSGDAQPLPKD